MKNDKNGKLIDAVGGIGEDLVKEAEAYDGARRRTGMIVRIASVAAVFVLAAVLLPLLFTMPRENGTVQPGKDLTPVLNPVSTGNDVEDRTSGSRAALPEELRGVSVRASESKGKIISTSEHFIIETEKSCETGTITEYLNLSPKTNYSITKLSGNSFEVVPEAESLYPGTVYRLSFGNPDNPAASYSFQTDSELIVKSMLPADMSEDVPVNTGIEIVFSEKLGDVDLGSLVSIEPAAECDYMLYPDGRTVAVIPKKQLEYATVYTVTVSDSAVSSTGKKLAESRTARFYTELSEKAALDYPFYVNIEKTNGRDSVNWNYYYYGSDEMIFSSDEDLVIAFSSWSSVAPNGTKKAAAELAEAQFLTGLK